MVVYSKFRTLFLARKAFGFFVMFFLCCVVLSYNDKYLLIFMLLLTLSIAITLFKLSNIYKLVIFENGITKISFLSDKKEFLNFSEVVSVNLNRIDGLQTRAGYISEGYYESIVLLKNHKALLVSPDHFENYRELVVALSENLTNYKINND